MRARTAAINPCTRHTPSARFSSNAPIYEVIKVTVKPFGPLKHKTKIPVLSLRHLPGPESSLKPTYYLLRGSETSAFTNYLKMVFHMLAVFDHGAHTKAYATCLCFSFPRPSCINVNAVCLAETARAPPGIESWEAEHLPHSTHTEAEHQVLDSSSTADLTTLSLVLSTVASFSSNNRYQPTVSIPFTAGTAAYWA